MKLIKRFVFQLYRSPSCRTCFRIFTTAGRSIRPFCPRRTESLWSALDTTGTLPAWKWTKFCTASPKRFCLLHLKLQQQKQQLCKVLPDINMQSVLDRWKTLPSSTWWTSQRCQTSTRCTSCTTPAQSCSFSGRTPTPPTKMMCIIGASTLRCRVFQEQTHHDRFGHR